MLTHNQGPDSYRDRFKPWWDHKSTGNRRFFLSMAAVYVVFSPTIDKFYIGATSLSAEEERMRRHNDHYYDFKFTSQASDWALFLEINCSSLSQALAIEKHIKRMKSPTFLRNLRLYPEMVKRLLNTYADS